MGLCSGRSCGEGAAASRSGLEEIGGGGGAHVLPCQVVLGQEGGFLELSGGWAGAGLLPNTRFFSSPAASCQGASILPLL